MNGFRLMCAPMQGLTEAAFRGIHAHMFNDGTEYYTPFIRVEKGEVRKRDLTDLTSSLNKNVNIVPQIIFRDVNEFTILVETLVSNGAERIDMNLGCPFPPQVKKGRGAGMLSNPGMLKEISTIVNTLAHSVGFSLKMRLGVSDSTEWRVLAETLNSMSLDHITVHPRTALQQYSGDLDLDEFRLLTDIIRHPVIFNGNIMSPDDIDRIREKFPVLKGAMVGRGLLCRPSLFTEWNQGILMDKPLLRDNALRLHYKLLDHYANTLCGDTQILSKIKPFIEFLTPHVERKKLKLLIKARKLTEYNAILTSLISAVP